MGEIINLRQARKARDRLDSERQAAASRLKHGRTKAAKRLAEAIEQKRQAAIDGARRDGGAD